MRLSAAILILCLALIGCAGAAPLTPDPAAGPTPSPVATATAEPTAAPPATPTPAPATPTPEPPSTPTAAPPATPTAAPEQPVHDVTIFDRGFNPASLEINPGEQVTWTNTGSQPHTVTFTNDGPDSGVLAGGATFRHAFDAAGTFEYICAIHPSMRGTISVGQ